MSDKGKINVPGKTEAEAKKTLRLKRIIAIVSLAIALALILWLTVYVTSSFMKGKSVEETVQDFKTLIDSYGSKGILVAFGIQVLQVIVSPIPGEVIELGMGLCYGWFGGMMLCLLGTALGASIIFVLTKKLGIKLVELFVPIEKINELRFINSDQKLARAVFILYLFPGTPKDPLIFFFGLTRIKLSSFLIISSIARIPSVVTSTISGHYVSKQEYGKAALIFIITALISLVCLILYKRVLAFLANHGKNANISDENKKENAQIAETDSAKAENASETDVSENAEPEEKKPDTAVKEECKSESKDKKKIKKECKDRSKNKEKTKKD